jgi:aldose 1-epimerase
VTTDTLFLDAGRARLTISPSDGGRMTSLVVDGHELLVTEGYGPIRWGCYPMAPWAGRIRDGRFTFRGRDVQLPRNMPPHAIHGTVFERPWAVVDASTIAVDLGPGWPFPGQVEQRFALDPDGLRVSMELVADEPMPVVVGWHPWFRRSVGGSAIELRFEPGRMLERGPDGLPTGTTVDPKPRPWDDCFVELRTLPRVSWGGVLALDITSSADHWVVYDESDDGLCVEPQTGPPDAVNIGGAAVVEPGTPLTAWMDWRWKATG